MITITCKNCSKVFQVYPYRIVSRKIQFCCKQCRIEYFDKNYIDILRERFLSLTHKDSKTTSTHVNTPCWIWRGNIDKYGYGYLTVMKPAKHKEPAARVSMFLFKPNENIDGVHTCHLCHNRLCVNPEHIHGGTAAVNIAEMVAAGLQVKGEACHDAKLTDNDVIDILTSLSKGILRSELAKKYNVGWTSINKIAQGKAWKHIPR